jgi:hypothetical protein
MKIKNFFKYFSFFKIKILLFFSLKLPNILVHDGTLKLADLGFARELDA